MDDRVCSWCWFLFTPPSKRSYCCSVKCLWALKRAFKGSLIHGGPRIETRKCKKCGKEFEGGRRTHQYCSRKCWQSIDRMKRNKKYGQFPVKYEAFYKASQLINKLQKELS